MNLMKNNSTASRWVNHHVGNIQNGGPSGPALLPEGIQTQVSGIGICFVRSALLPVGIQTQVSGEEICFVRPALLPVGIQTQVSGDEKFLERIRQLEDELDKARFIQGNLLTQQSRELRQEKQEKERKKKYFSEIIRRKDEKIKGLRNGKQN
ncbi:uncharacterized protein LOC111698049 isoform X2 [Eurytemora carolleeae]|uniref:uncharacterized protein LOC111698049 isoform X2 n=1 Tax=Eurytemora carolleeae TaxID=1294199 RepID=UPI000C7601E4|nr:uncharacterized protein LOC111698049 isoform X2 [Eurytemora carolleeae]|eukprot:XP_023324044.1 uncharacterized protein LOC111698049 isoform X2 [Eurytemora affinis]